MFECILFDLDGTLTNPKEGITKCVKYAIEASGRQVPSLDELEIFIGPPLKEQFKSYLSTDDEEGEFLLGKYRERFATVGIFENEIYPGIAGLLERLKNSGKKIALATSKPTVFAEKILFHFNILQYFDTVVGSELDGRRIDKEEVVAEVLSRLNPDPTKTVMISDRCFDIIGGKKFGLKTIGVKYGFAKENELEKENPDYIANSVSEREEMLCILRMQ